MIDVTSESTISLVQAARLLPPGRGERPVTLSCLLRWVLQGARGPDSSRIRLEALRLGGRWVTSREALQRFAERLTPAGDTPTSPPPRTARQRQRASERAAQNLDKIGI
jgi:hypothetical protein